MITLNARRIHVHLVIMAQLGLLLHPLPEPLVIDDVVGAHQPRQVKGLRGRIDRDRPLPGILG